MKDRPILFSGPMVRAILAGTKTQTRRVVKCHPILGGASDWCERAAAGDTELNRIRRFVGDYRRFCPYGAPGDLLWVRETFSPTDSSGMACQIGDAAFAVLRDGTQVYPDGEIIPPSVGGYAPNAFDRCKFRPSIHMPRWASRLTLRITDVRVERLNAISEADAIAEGVERFDTGFRDYTRPRPGEPTGACFAEARDSFESLWESINGAGSWAANPWVWVVGFEVVR